MTEAGRSCGHPATLRRAGIWFVFVMGTRKKNPATSTKDWPALNTTIRPIADLKANPKNSRKHSAAQIESIGKSLQQWGWTMPVLVDEAGEIIAGHARVEAAQVLGITDAPVVVAKGWTAAQKRAYVIADNQLALNSEWDDELLRSELADLGDIGFDLGPIGFDDAALAALLSDPDNAPTVESEWQGMPEFVSEDQTSFRQVIVHFKDQADVEAFAKLIGQKITPKQKSLWYPAAEIGRFADKRYAAS